jgi:hypothetical protein
VSRRRWIVLSLVVAAAIAAGVAAVAELRSSSAHAALAGDADQLCGDYHDAVAQLRSTAAALPVAERAAREKRLAVRLERALGKLDVPRQDTRAYKRFLALVARQVALLDAQRRATVAHDGAAFARATARSRRVHAEESDVAKRLGFYVCGA